MKKIYFIVLCLFLISCNILDPVNRVVRLRNNSSNLIFYNEYYISNPIKNGKREPYYKVLKFSENGKIVAYNYFGQPLLLTEEQLIFDKYNKGWRFEVKDTNIFIEYIFRTPARTLAYYNGFISSNKTIILTDGIIPDLKSKNFHGLDTLYYYGSVNDNGQK